MFDANGDDGVAFNRHFPKLWIARAQQALRFAMLVALRQDIRLTTQHQPTKARPILVVIKVNDKSNGTIFGDIPQPFQRQFLLPLWLVIDGDVNVGTSQDVAHRRDMGHATAIRRRQMANALRIEELSLCVR